MTSYMLSLRTEST